MGRRVRRFNCQVCGKDSKAYGRDQDAAKFCGRACRNAWLRQNAKCWIVCEFCGKSARSQNAGGRFCSRECAAQARSGPLNRNWLDIPRTKTCEWCGKEYGPKPTAITSFVRGRFCSRECGWKGQRYLRGQDNPQWRPDARNRTRAKAIAAWAQTVISRDLATCQKCGATGVELHAHHIRSYRDHPELRTELSNGITLCAQCHWAEHGRSAANGVNSGDTVPGNVDGNPEPSDDRKVVEGVTARRRAYRRIEANCASCGKFVSKRPSSATGRQIFCSRDCASRLAKPGNPDLWVDIPCGHCGAQVRKYVPNIKRHATSFCDRACSARYHNRLRSPKAVISPKSAPAAS